jgi:hypothetical protein
MSNQPTVTPRTRRAKKVEDFRGVIEEILNIDPNSELKKVLDFNSIASLDQLLAFKDEELKTLLFNDAGNLKTIQKVDAAILRIFHAWN